MERERIFDAWSPAGGRWSRWVKPPLFAQLNERLAVALDDPYRQAAGPWAKVDVSWAPAPGASALVVDLPGGDAIHTGLALAARGYRPVPVLNVCTAVGEVIDQRPLLEALRAGAPYLAGLALPEGAPPAFLVDSRRATPDRPLVVGAFDNRWMLFPNDFPSARFLLGHGITRALLVVAGPERPATDTLDVLQTWRERLTLERLALDGDRALQDVPQHGATWLGRLLARTKAVEGLHGGRWFTSGFGGRVPPPSPPSHG